MSVGEATSPDAAKQLEARIHSGIPLSVAMGCRIAALDACSIRIEAPLTPNLNVHGSGFAGSLYALGILSAWGLCAHLIERAGLEAELVVASARIEYLAPLRDDPVCEAEITPGQAQAFAGALARDRRARLAVPVRIGAGPAARIDALMHARIA